MPQTCKTSSELIDAVWGYLAERSKNVFNHDFDCGFVCAIGAIFAPLVLKTVFVLESYLNGRRSSLAIFKSRLLCSFLSWRVATFNVVTFLAGIKISCFGIIGRIPKLKANNQLSS